MFYFFGRRKTICRLRNLSNDLVIFRIIPPSFSYDDHRTTFCPNKIRISAMTSEQIFGVPK